MLNLVNIRKELHKIPELGFEEFKTQEYLLNILKNFDGLNIHTFAFPGILVEYSHGAGEYKFFRADMDGLPITEETNCDFESEHKGKMHACGHDMHMTILIGLIEKVITAELKENLLFLFQPAEEEKGGATRIIKTKILDRFSVSEAYALHVKGKMKTGKIASKPGIFFANTREIEVVFKGIGAHIAFAEKGINALKAGAEFYLELEEEIKREFPIGKPVICSFGKMNAGVIRNTIPAECRLEGTLRAFTNENHEILKALIENLRSKIAKKYDIDAELIYKSYYKEVINNKDLYKKLKVIAAEMKLEFIESEMVFTGEDFGFFTEKYNGLLFWLGVGNDDDSDLHSSKFLPDEEAINIGISIFFHLMISK